MTILGATLAALLAATSPASIAHDSTGEPDETETIAGHDDGQKRMTVPVRIGEHGPFRFVIDTGAQRTVLSNELAERLDLPPLARQQVVGIAGTEIADMALLGELGLGTRSFFDLMVPLFASQHIGADGIVGVDSLQQQRVLIDFDRNSMAVGDARGQGGNSGFEIVVTARRRSGQLILTDAVIDGIKTAVVIDTGASTSIGNRALQRALGQRRKLSRATVVSVTGQQAVVDVGSARQLSIGGIKISNAIIAYADGPAFAALDLQHRPALMLGMRELRLFRRVAIDFSKRKVFFDLPS